MTTSRINSACGENRLSFLGGINSKKWIENGNNFSRNYKQGYRIYSSRGIACSITAKGGGLGGETGLYMVEESKMKQQLEFQCAAMRGRYNSEGKLEQRLELGSSDHTNALTTVSKDNYIIEKRKEQ